MMQTKITIDEMSIIEKTVDKTKDILSDTAEMPDNEVVSQESIKPSTDVMETTVQTQSNAPPNEDIELPEQREETETDILADTPEQSNIAGNQY